MPFRIDKLIDCFMFCPTLKTVCPICWTVCPICCELFWIFRELKYPFVRSNVFFLKPPGPTGPIFWSLGPSWPLPSALVAYYFYIWHKLRYTIESLGTGLDHWFISHMITSLMKLDWLLPFLEYNYLFQVLGILLKTVRKYNIYLHKCMIRRFFFIFFIFLSTNKIWFLNLFGPSQG